MSRFAGPLAASLVVASLVAESPAGRAAPVPKHLMKNELGPCLATRVGARLEYENGTVHVVSKVEEREGKKVVTVVHEANGLPGSVYQVVEVSEAGLNRTQGNGTPLDPPLTLVKWPVVAGDSWTYRTAGLAGKKTVIGVERVKVPAGTFEAVRVVTESTIDPSYKSTAWYAPGVGLVKLTQGGQDTQVLKSFTPGKE